MEHLDILLLTATIILGTLGGGYTFHAYKNYDNKFLLDMVWYIIFFNLFVLSQLFFVYAYVNILVDYPTLVLQKILIAHKFLDFLAQVGIAYYFISILFDFLDKQKSTDFVKKFRMAAAFFTLGFFFAVIGYIDSARLNLFLIIKMVSEYVFVIFLFTGLVYLLVNSRKIKDTNRRKAVTLFGYFYILTFFLLVLMAVVLKNRGLYVTILSLLLNVFPIVWLKVVYLKYCLHSGLSLNHVNLAKIFSEKYNISSREIEVLNLLIAGKSNKEIEDLLFISINTVKNHVSCLFRKLGISSRGQLMNLVIMLSNTQISESPKQK